MIIVNGWKPLTIITKSSPLDVAAVLGPPLHRGILKILLEYSSFYLLNYLQIIFQIVGVT